MAPTLALPAVMSPDAVPGSPNLEEDVDGVFPAFCFNICGEARR